MFYHYIISVFVQEMIDQYQSNELVSHCEMGMENPDWARGAMARHLQKEIFDGKGDGLPPKH